MNKTFTDPEDNTRVTRHNEQDLLEARVLRLFDVVLQQRTREGRHMYDRHL
jgi:hypothetical protein